MGKNEGYKRGSPLLFIPAAWGEMTEEETGMSGIGFKKYGAGYLTADLDPFAVSRVGFAPPDRLVLCFSGVCRRLQE